MNPNSNPLDYLLQCCDDAITTGHWKLDRFIILNARDELQRLRQKVADSYQELFNCNQDLVEEITKNLDYKVAAWGRLNDKGDIYDPSICNNPHINPNTVVSLYVNINEYNEKYDKLSQ